MGSGVPVQHYDAFRQATAFVCSSLDGRTALARDEDGMVDGVTDDSLEGEDGSNAIECMQETYQESQQMHLGIEDGCLSLQSMENSDNHYDMITVDDIVPIETARTRLLEIVVENFVGEHVIEVRDGEMYHSVSLVQDKLGKRRQNDFRYEGDSRFVLPLMYIANMYETLVSTVNLRMNSFNHGREKTIGIALEAAGGLYRKLAKRFPRKGPYSFRRRELATSVETRTRFPELVIQDEKRVRFVVVNGLEIVEEPNNMSISDIEWFKRLTGRSEAAIYAADYKFYSPRHKYRRSASTSVMNIPNQSAIHNTDDNSSILCAVQAYNTGLSRKHELQGEEYQQPMDSSSFSNNSVAHQPHQIHGLHLLGGGRAKFCDECGAPYLRDTSKFCSECGVKRLGT